MRQERHTSPDELLTLVVVWEDDDVSVGFEGYEWHTHGDVLFVEHGGSESEEQAVQSFVEDILSNRLPIAILRLNGKIHDAWVTDDPQDELKYELPGETLELRRWDGSRVES